MATPSGVLKDGSLLSHIDRAFYKLETKLALLSGVAIFCIVILAVISVSGRIFLNTPLPGYVDWIEQLMPLIALAGISYTQRNGGHIRMDILVGKINGRSLWLFEWITSFFILLLTVLLIWGTWEHFARSFDFQSPFWSRDSSIDIAIPLWPTKLLIPIALFILALRVIIQLWGYGLAFIKNIPFPVAVPLVQNTEEQAKEESKLME